MSSFVLQENLFDICVKRMDLEQRERDLWQRPAKRQLIVIVQAEGDKRLYQCGDCVNGGKERTSGVGGEKAGEIGSILGVHDGIVGALGGGCKLQIGGTLRICGLGQKLPVFES